ncbi:MAG: GNAT family N-acetyltransferase [Mycetocola sp.]
MATPNTSADVTVVTATRDQQARAALVLAEAFADDPVLGSFVRGEHNRRRRIALLFLAMIRSAGSHGQVDVALDSDGTILGAAVWEKPRTGRAQLNLDPTPTAMMIKAIGVRHLGTAARYQSILAQYRPGIPHWYLGELGVAAAGRGRGVGTALLSHGLDRAEQNNGPVYLESSTPRNRTLYRRNGFIELAPITGVGDAAPAAMWRPAPATPPTA